MYTTRHIGYLLKVSLKSDQKLRRFSRNIHTHRPTERLADRQTDRQLGSFGPERSQYIQSMKTTDRNYKPFPKRLFLTLI